MPQIIIEMTEAELFALDLISIDKQEWADNVLTDRARIAKEELKNSTQWALAIAALATAGGDVQDDWAVLLKGRDEGIIKTLAQTQADNPPIPLPIEEPPAPPTTYNIPKQLPFIRATEEEAEQLEALLNSAPARLRMIYQGATQINSGDELFATLVGMISTVLGEARASELLAPQ